MTSPVPVSRDAVSGMFLTWAHGISPEHHNGLATSFRDSNALSSDPQSALLFKKKKYFRERERVRESASVCTYLHKQGERGEGESQIASQAESVLSSSPRGTKIHDPET